MKRTLLLLPCLILLASCEAKVDYGSILDVDQERKQAVSEKNPELCLGIKDETGEKTALRQDRCFEEVSIASGMAQTCLRVKDGERQRNCIRTTAKDAKDVNACSLLSVDIDKDDCYLDVAGAKEELSVCSKIKHQETFKACVQKVARSKGNIEICSSLDDEPMTQGWCVTEVALAKRDPSLCMRSKDQSTAVDCYSRLAASQADVTVCDGLKAAAQAEQCRSYYARVKIEPDICRELQNDYVHDECLAYIAKQKRDTALCREMRRDEAIGPCERYE